MKGNVLGICYLEIFDFFFFLQLLSFRPKHPIRLYLISFLFMNWIVNYFAKDTRFFCIMPFFTWNHCQYFSSPWTFWRGHKNNRFNVTIFMTKRELLNFYRCWVLLSDNDETKRNLKRLFFPNGYLERSFRQLY